MGEMMTVTIWYLEEAIAYYENFLKDNQEDFEEDELKEENKFLERFKRIKQYGGDVHMVYLSEYFKLLEDVSKLTDGEYAVENDGTLINCLCD